jgi:Cft2 family RNA processing exonuclease
VTFSSPGQLLVTLIGEAADVALSSSTLAGKNVDRNEFIALNRTNLLTIIAAQPNLRVKLSRDYQDQLRATQSCHVLLDNLLSPDAETSATAATQLSTDQAALVGPATGQLARQTAMERRRATSANSPSPDGRSADDRRATRLQRDLERVRVHRDQARGQLEYARQELRDVKTERDAALSDRDEALTAAESLRVELTAIRAHTAALSGDVVHAATVLAGALRPAQVPEPEHDVRELDRQDSLEIGPDTGPEMAAMAMTRAPVEELVTEALARAAIDVDAFLAALDAITVPAAPVRRPADLFVHPRAITVTPLGGGTDIGGSCILVEAGDARILVDCGTRPKQRLSRIGPPELGAALGDGREVDAVIITHAHNDHAGFVPVLVSRYPFMDVLATADTAALLPTMWNDSVKVFERTGHERVQPGEPADEPPYRTAQVLAALNRVRGVELGRVVEIADGVTVELFPAGHILGAAGVVITAGTSRVTVTGDVSHPAQAQASVSGLVVPDTARGSDLLVIESTYCRKGGVPRARELENFVRTVRDTVGNGGRVLVPAFALGRAQEVILTLRKELPGVPVLVDGLAKQISRIYEQQTAGSDNPLAIFSEDVREVAPGTRREQYLAMRRGVIVTTSGMLVGGPAVTWARWLLPDPKAALLVSGYQDGESAGAELLALAENPSSMFNLEGDPIQVQATVKQFALSAHADRGGLTSIIADVSPRQVMLVHGIASAQRDFADHLRWHGHAVAPTERWATYR